MSRSVSSSSSHAHRSNTPNFTGAGSESVSTVSSSSSQDEDSPVSGSPRGDIRLGTHTRVTSDVSSQGSESPASAGDGNAGYIPECTPNVRYLIRSTTLLVGCASLTAMIYGGLKITMPADPGVDAKRAEHMGLMVAGGVGLVIAFLTSSLTMRTAEPRIQETNPA